MNSRTKERLSRFFATFSVVLGVVTLFVLGIPHQPFLSQDGLWWFVAAFTSLATSYALDHWPATSNPPA
jgi:hypothetical protein